MFVFNFIFYYDFNHHKKLEPKIEIFNCMFLFLCMHDGRGIWDGNPVFPSELGNSVCDVGQLL